jgi:signal transduction histidine kinase
MKETANSTDDLEKPQIKPEEQVEKRLPELHHTDQLFLNSEQLTAIDRVSSAIIQEFNNPLQAITNILVGIHRRGFLEPEDMPLVDLAYHEVIKLNQLVRELREFHQPTCGRTDLFDTQRELAKLIDLNKQRLSDAGISIITEFAQDTPLIHAVSDQIRTVFQSLLDIAMEACNRDDSIHLSTSVDKSAIVLQIRRYDCSIDQTVAMQHFEPLNTSISNTSDQELRLAKGCAIITMHGGTIEADVYQGKGTAFKVRIPTNSSGYQERV